MQEILRERLEQLKKGLFIEEKRAKIKTLEERVGDEDTWKNWEEGNAVTRDLSSLKKDIEDYEMLELMAEEGDNENFERLECTNVTQKKTNGNGTKFMLFRETKRVSKQAPSK